VKIKRIIETPKMIPISTEILNYTRIHFSHYY
jgi:hypothetical protein